MALDTRQTANILGLSGLIPFAALSLATIFLPAWRPQAAYALATYGALILSFLGAIYWGVAIVTRRESAAGPAMLAASNVPFFVAWGALLLPLRPCLLILAAALVAHLALDRTVARNADIPPWWWPLRVRLSGGAGACLLLAGLFVA